MPEQQDHLNQFAALALYSRRASERSFQEQRLLAGYEPPQATHGLPSYRTVRLRLDGDSSHVSREAAVGLALPKLKEMVAAGGSNPLRLTSPVWADLAQRCGLRFGGSSGERQAVLAVSCCS